MKTRTTNMKRDYLYGTIIFFLLIMVYSLVLIKSPEKVAKLTREDGIIETFSAVFYFLAAGLLFYLFFKSRSEKRIYFLKTRRNYFFLLLGLLFIFYCGEEISWGQRIFGFETPEYLQDINAQGETNIHNLFVFHGADKNHNIKTGLEHWMTGARIFALFWVVYCLLIPVLYKLASKASNFIRKIHFPVVSLWIGILFLLNHIISKLFERIEHFTLNTHAIVEIKETNFAFLFFVASISLYVIYRNDVDKDYVK